MPLNNVRAFLDEHHIKYVVISHSKAYTAQGIAAVAHIPGQELAKTVIVKLDGALAMAVLPAPYQVDLLAQETHRRGRRRSSQREGVQTALS